MNILSKRAAEPTEYPKPLPPEVVEHMRGITALHQQLQIETARADAAEAREEEALIEIRGLQTELATVKRSHNNEERLRRHFEKLATALTIRVTDARTYFDKMFADVQKTMAEATGDDGKPIPKFLAAGPRPAPGPEPGQEEPMP